jgi:hypothetical protein
MLLYRYAKEKGQISLFQTHLTLFYCIVRHIVSLLSRPEAFVSRDAVQIAVYFDVYRVPLYLLIFRLNSTTVRA